MQRADESGASKRPMKTEKLTFPSKPAVSIRAVLNKKQRDIAVLLASSPEATSYLRRGYFHEHPTAEDILPSATKIARVRYDLHKLERAERPGCSPLRCELLSNRCKERH